MNLLNIRTIADGPGTPFLLVDSAKVQRNIDRLDERLGAEHNDQVAAMRTRLINADHRRESCS
jgi:D-serine deaminase-like pyridoxal phosphate-dependent protein